MTGGRPVCYTVHTKRPLPPVTPLPLQPGPPFPRVRRDDPLTIHIRDKSDPHHVRDRLVDIGVLRKNGDGSYSPYLPAKADLVNGKVPASQLPEDQQGVTDVLVDGESVVSGGTANIDLTGKVDKEQGKGLSSNDYTAEEKTKLANVEAGAQKNVTPVAPSTDDSASGKPADAKATGDALVSGFTDWSFTGVPEGATFTLRWSSRGTWTYTIVYPGGETYSGVLFDYAEDEEEIRIEEHGLDVVATRVKICPTKTSELVNDSGFLTAHQSWADVLPTDGVPKTDLASDVQSSLGKANTALQSAPVTSVNTKTGAVVLDASEIINPSSPAQGATVAADVYELYQSKASKADIPYKLGSVAYGGTPANRTVNILPVSSSSIVSVELPELDSTSVFDVLFDIDNSAGSSPAEVDLEDYGLDYLLAVDEGDVLADVLFVPAGKRSRFYITQTGFSATYGGDELPVLHITRKEIDVPLPS